VFIQIQYPKGGLMSENEQTYKVGDWIVHLTYGVGQVKKLEKKPIGGTQQMCYHVRTNDGVFWLPVENADNERVRPIAGPKRIQRALNFLKRAPKKMAANFQSRRKRIKRVSLDGDLNTDLKLVRDLNARQFKKGLNATEQDAFNTIVKRFLQEWSLSKDIEIDEAHEMLEQFLKESRQKAKKKKESVAA
jgi:RNA polymerase-interacting CarD/CdnL/TRCF family regulator